jgi:hypothetical protein
MLTDGWSVFRQFNDEVSTIELFNFERGRNMGEGWVSDDGMFQGVSYSQILTQVFQNFIKFNKTLNKDPSPRHVSCNLYISQIQNNGQRNEPVYERHSGVVGTSDLLRSGLRCHLGGRIWWLEKFLDFHHHLQAHSGRITSNRTCCLLSHHSKVLFVVILHFNAIQYVTFRKCR